VSEFFADELALILNCSRAAATKLADSAVLLTERLPSTWAALADGQLDWPRARALAAELIDPARDAAPHVLAEVEAAVLPRAHELSIPRLQGRSHGATALRATVTRAELERLVRHGCPEHPGEPCRCSVLDRPPPVDRYVPTPAQRRFVSTRDRTCRHPGCRNAAAWADLDHVIPHAVGGPTACENLCCLSPAPPAQDPCTRLAIRQDTRWRSHGDHTRRGDPHHPPTRSAPPPGWSLSPPDDDPPPF
jgi:hypothetical protein